MYFSSGRRAPPCEEHRTKKGVHTFISRPWACFSIGIYTCQRDVRGPPRRGASHIKRCTFISRPWARFRQSIYIYTFHRDVRGPPRRGASDKKRCTFISRPWARFSIGMYLSSGLRQRSPQVKSIRQKKGAPSIRGHGLVFVNRDVLLIGT